MQDVGDDELVSRLQQGDEEALRRLYDRYLDRVFLFCLRVMGRAEEAEEIAGDALLQAFRHARDYRGEGNFSGWLFRIARNLCLGRLRRGRWLQVVSLEELAETDWESVGEERRDSLLHLAVQEAMQQLPSDYRAVLMMRDVEGLTSAEAARALGRSPAAAKSLHFRARQALRDALVGALGMEEQ